MTSAPAANPAAAAAAATIAVATATGLGRLHKPRDGLDCSLETILQAPQALHSLRHLRRQRTAERILVVLLLLCPLPP